MFRIILTFAFTLSLPIAALAQSCPDAVITLKVKTKQYSSKGRLASKNTNFTCGALPQNKRAILIPVKGVQCGYRTIKQLKGEYEKQIKKLRKARKGSSKIRSYQQKIYNLTNLEKPALKSCNKYNFSELLAPLVVSPASVLVPETGQASLDLKALNPGLPGNSTFELTSASGNVHISGSLLTMSAAYNSVPSGISYRARAGTKISNVAGVEVILDSAGEFSGNPQSLVQYRDRLTQKEVRHLFNKIGFGATREEVSRGLEIGLSRLVDELVEACDPSSQVFQRINARAQRIREERRVQACENINNQQYCTAEKIVHTFPSERQYLLEHFRYGSPVCASMFMLLHNHFAVNQNGNLWNNHLHDVAADHLNLIMNNLVGKYDVLVSKMHADASMLLWLNNNDNTWQSPNENYGREVMELFMLGVTDPITGQINYDEFDVKQMTRAVSGYKIDYIQQNLTAYNNGTAGTISVWKRVPSFVHARWMQNPGSPAPLTLFHDTPFSGISPFIANSWLRLDPVYGQDTLTPYVLYNHPSAPRLLATQLIGNFISPKASKVLIEGTSEFILNQGYDLKSVLKLILKSEALFSSANRNTAFKSPTEFTMSVIRSLNLPLLYSIPTENLVDRLGDSIAEAGQAIMAPPSVFGWKTAGTWRNGKIEDGSEFLSGPNLLSRERGLTMYLRGLGQYIPQGQFTWRTTLSEFQNPGDPGSVADEMAAALGFELTAPQRAVIVEYMTTVLFDANGAPRPYSWKFNDDSYLNIKLSGVMMLISTMKGAHIK